MRDLYGSAQVDAAIASVSEDVRRELESLTPNGWCLASTASALKHELARRVGEGALSLQRRVVERGTEKTLHGAWRFFLSRLSDPWLMKFSPLIYSKAFDCGSLAVERILAGRAEIVVRGWPDMPDFDCFGLAAGIETILALARRERPKVTWMRRGDEIRFVAIWDLASGKAR